ncbi:radical SAM protein [Pelomyxa schiedti]|nr:radical SAM protein [Pelomyxa schiedti]
MASTGLRTGCTHILRISFVKVQVTVFDPAHALLCDTLTSFVNMVSMCKYHVIGFSPVRFLVGEDLFFMTEIYEATKTQQPRPLFLAGGQEASIDYRLLFKCLPWLDCCISGLGELPISRIIENMMKSNLNHPSPAQGIPGAICRGEVYDIESILTGPVSTALFSELSCYNGRNIPYWRYWRATDCSISSSVEIFHTLRIHTVSFCPYNCSFCTSKKFGKLAYSSRSALSVMDVVKLISSATALPLRCPLVHFNDDDFLLSPERALHLFTEIIKAKQVGLLPTTLKLFGQTRVTSVDSASLQAGVQAGLQLLSFGVESFSDSVLHAEDMNKGFFAGQAFESVRNSIQSGVPCTNINLILYHPTVSIQGLMETIQSAVALLQISFAEHSRMSLACIPFLNVHAGISLVVFSCLGFSILGSPLMKLARIHDWPVVFKSQVLPNGTQEEYPSHLLPKDNFIREAVTRLQPTFSGLLSCVTSHPCWPCSSVDRTIGVTGILHFATAITILEIHHPHITVQFLLSLALETALHSAFLCTGPTRGLNSDLLERNKREACKLLSREDHNILFSFSPIHRVWAFTSGGKSIPISPAVCHTLGRESLPKSTIPGGESILLPLRHTPASVIYDMLFQHFSGAVTLARTDFGRVLLVVPCTVPAVHHKEEALCLALTKETDFLDCCVFYPSKKSLVSHELADFLTINDFDVVYFTHEFEDSRFFSVVHKHSPYSIVLCRGKNHLLCHSVVWSTKFSVSDIAFVLKSCFTSKASYKHDWLPHFKDSINSSANIKYLS